MRRLFCTIRELVEERFAGAFQEKRDLRWQGVSAFCFLRFIVPAILNPHLFHLYPGLFCLTVSPVAVVEPCRRSADSARPAEPNFDCKGYTESSQSQLCRSA